MFGDLSERNTLNNLFIIILERHFNFLGKMLF